MGAAGVLAYMGRSYLRRGWRYLRKHPIKIHE
jgi:hypothetical protein